MRFELLVSLLAAAPSALAAFAATAYTPPAELLAKVLQTQDCILPADYLIQNFVGKSNSTGPEAPLIAYNFTFRDEATKIMTFCEFNSSSVSTTPPGLTSRFSCQNRDVKFIWTDAQRKLTMIERICPRVDGIPAYEVSGSVLLFLSCDASGACVSNSTEYSARYFSIGPVRDPTFVKKWTA